MHNQQLAEQILEKIQDPKITSVQKYFLYRFIVSWLFRKGQNIIYSCLSDKQTHSYLLQKLENYRIFNPVHSLEQLQVEKVYSILDSKPTIFVDFQQLFNELNNEQHLQKDIFNQYLNSMDQCQYDLYTINHRGNFVIVNNQNIQNLVFQNIVCDDVIVEQTLQQLSNNLFTTKANQLNIISVNMNFQPTQFPQQLLQFQIKSLVICNQHSINLYHPDSLISLNLIRCNGVSYCSFINIRTLFINDSSNLQVSALKGLKKLECLVVQNAQFSDCSEAEQCRETFKALEGHQKLFKTSLRCQQCIDVVINLDLYPQLEHIYIFSQIVQNIVVRVYNTPCNVVMLIETNIKIEFDTSKPENVLVNLIEY